MIALTVKLTTTIQPSPSTRLNLSLRNIEYADDDEQCTSEFDTFNQVSVISITFNLSQTTRLLKSKTLLQKMGAVNKRQDNVDGDAADSFREETLLIVY